MAGQRVVAIVGPTAVGKTRVAIEIARHLGTEIISADSRQIYRELKIGTAKPSADELRQVKHHFVNTISINEEYDAGTFGREARVVVDQLLESHGVAVVCGGSGLYIKALLEGFDDLPNVPSEVREKITVQFAEKGLPWLQDEVARQDPDYFGTVDRQNPQRLMRALEIIRGSGKPFSGFHKKKKVDLPFDVIKIGLELEREQLYGRIDNRMDKMITDGLFDEAVHFSSQRHLNALQTVGYQEIFGFLDGVYGRDEAIRLLKRNSRRYAKRQMTWFRKDKEVKWFHPDDMNGMLKYMGGQGDK